jgi:peptide/nickel transport system substrate-binding protein
VRLGQAIADTLRRQETGFTLRPQLDRAFSTTVCRAFPTNVFVIPERIASTPATEQFKEIIRSGPYRFLANEWQPSAIAHYARFVKYVPRSEPPDLWSAKIANFDRVEWTAQPDRATAAAALQRGEVDWVEQSLLDLLPMLQKTPGIKVEAVDPFGALAILRFNQLIPPFHNPVLHRALLPAINQQNVVTAVVGDQTQFGKFPIGFFTAGSPMSNDTSMRALAGPRSMDEARKRIAAAGYKGERIVMIAPSDLPAIMTMSHGHAGPAHS